FGLLELGLTSSYREDVTWSGGNLVRASFFAFFVKRQLDLSSVAARLRGGPVWFVRVRSFPTEPVTRETNPYLLPVRPAFAASPARELQLRRRELPLQTTRKCPPGQGKREALAPWPAEEQEERTCNFHPLKKKATTRLSRPRRRRSSRRVPFFEFCYSA
ncbi:hypothetical protein Taro_050261, partial [Colocasia esculenta]|nr:hypothetical protein [Colocasia esculenta]